MKQFASTYFAIVFIAFCASSVLAQPSIVTSAEKTTIMLGEPLLVNVSITGQQAFNPVIPDTLGHFEVLERKPLESKRKNGSIVTRQQIVVTCFDSGIQRLPPVSVEGNPSVLSSGIDIAVNTLPADAKTKYGDIKQIISLQQPDQLPYIVMLSLATLLSAVGIYRLSIKRLQMPHLQTTSVAFETVSATGLLSQIDKLRNDWQQNQINSCVLGNRLMEIFRIFLSGKGIYSSSKTGEELIITTKTRYNSETWQGIVQSIRLCNAMRFGRYNAVTGEGNQSIDVFEAAITKFDDDKAPTLKNA